MKKNFMFIAMIISILFFVTACGGTIAEIDEGTDLLEVVSCIQIDSLTFQRKSRQEIALEWRRDYDDVIDVYFVKRREIIPGKDAGEWQTLALLETEHADDAPTWQYVDRLSDDSFRQYEYRIDMQVCDTNHFAAVEGKTILASNVKICIDPGHYSIAREVAEVDEYHYVEGDFVLALGLELQRVLKEEYGIEACLTRDSDTITLSGYKDDELDSTHISLRGEYAAEQDCDLFVSLHTNSNAEDANGYSTFFQPISINKPIIIVNQTAMKSKEALRTANAVGVNLASVNYALELADTDAFHAILLEEVKEAETNTSDESAGIEESGFEEKKQVELKEWSKSYNDALEEQGTVLCRTGSKGDDYYGVLRGAAKCDVPGMIIEHGFHSVQEVRKAASEGQLKQMWAQADAYGIAYGFGFCEKISGWSDENDTK